MKRKVALKRLSASDLTIFEHHYRTTSGTKQKAINLDVDVFIKQLYPGLAGKSDGSHARIPLDLSVFGPGSAGLHNIQRKILKQDKNWRLNGELIYGPPENEHRYDQLVRGDYVILDFQGDTEPKSARAYLVAQTVPEDTTLHAALEAKYASAFSARKGMEIVDLDEITVLIGALSLTDNHPILDLTETDALEDAVQGGFVGVTEIRKRRQARGISREEFEQARRRAEQNGAHGEELLNAWLQAEFESGRIKGFRWESQQNPLAPYDFALTDGSSDVRKIDAKSTGGGFNNSIHVSIAELLEMKDCGLPYDLYRLYALDGATARMRVARDVGRFAVVILRFLAGLPKGVTVDGISIDPRTLDFDQEIVIDLSVVSDA